MTDTGTSQPAGPAAEAETDADSAARSAEARSGGRSRPNRWKVAFVTLLVLGVLGTSAWVLLGSKLLVVRHVEVTGTKIAPRDRVVAAAGIRLGLPMVRLGTGSVRDRVEGLREVQSAKVVRKWPATVRIVVRERVPVAVVERDRRFYQLDRDGVTVTDGATRPRLPTLSVAAPGPTDPPTLTALRVVSELPDRLKRRVAEVAAPSPESVSMRLAGGLTVVWGSADRPQEKLRLFEALQRSPAGRSAQTIDVSSPEVVTTR